MPRPFDGRELSELLRHLGQPDALTELAVLVGCLAAAWFVAWAVGGRRRHAASVWFGRRIVDGVLFPILALTFAFGARLTLERILTPAVFRVAIPVLVSLVAIRLSVRVLSATFTETPWVRTAERSISWIAWIAVVLWVTGVSPRMLDAMNQVRWNVGTTEVSLRNVVEGSAHRGRRPGAHALAVGSDRAASPARIRQRPVAAQDRGEPGARAALLRRSAARAVGGRHRPDGAVGGGRRNRRRPRLRAAEDRGELRQRLRDPRRAEFAHRRHGEDRELRRGASPTFARATP